MRKIIFQYWCSKAVSGIHCSPEKENVSQELFDHMEDIYQSLIDQGVDPKVAQVQTVEAMGSAEEIAPQLAAIHRPFWGMVEHFCRKALVVLAAIAFLFANYFILQNILIDPILQDFDPNAGPSGGEARQVLYLEPDFSASSDGYTLTVTRASVWKQAFGSAPKSQERTYCNVQIEVSNPLPWADFPDFSDWYWAEDSLGNYYYSAAEDSSGNECSIQAADYRTGFFTTTQDLWLSPCVSEEAEWIKLHYDRSGRDIVLYIDLTGGEQP